MKKHHKIKLFVFIIITNLYNIFSFEAHSLNSNYAHFNKWFCNSISFVEGKSKWYSFINPNDHLLYTIDFFSYNTIIAFLVYTIVALFIILGLYRFCFYRLELRYKEQKTEFIINATQNILSPLSLIKNPLKKLRSYPESEEMDRYIETIERNSDRILTLVEQMLDVKEINESEVNNYCERVEMVSFISSICTLFVFTAHERQITINQISEKPFIEVCYNREKLRIIFINIMSKAINSTFKGANIGINIEINKHQLIAKIKVDNIGTDQNIKYSLFRWFYQWCIILRYTIYRVQMYLYNFLSEFRKGSIKTSSEIDKNGAVSFIISLPTRNAPLNSDLLGENIINNFEVKVSNKDNKRLNILLAYNDKEVVKYIKMELRKRYKIDVVYNAEEALNSLFKDKYDVVVTDFLLPTMNGMSLLRRIKENPNISDIPIILLISQGEIEYRVKALRYGANAFISKPLDIEELRATIDNLVENVRRLRGKFYNSHYQCDRFDNVAIKSNNEELMDNIMTCINSNYVNPEYNVEQLAADLFMSRAQLHRRMKEMTGMSCGDFIRNIRLQQAALIIKSKRVNISQVAFAVGFNSHAHFSTLFKKYYGKSPLEYAQMENQKH